MRRLTKVKSKLKSKLLHLLPRKKACIKPTKGSIVVFNTRFQLFVCMVQNTN